MGRVILLALALASCAPPQQFERGAYVPAPTARPGVGAPVVGQPRAREVPPRSPHKRALPPTAGPGIWAGDEPKADNGAVPMLLESPISPPDDATSEERAAVAACVGWFSELFVHVARASDDLRRLDPVERMCALRMLVDECLGDPARKADPLFRRRMGDLTYALCKDRYNDLSRLISDIYRSRKVFVAPSGGPLQ